MMVTVCPFNLAKFMVILLLIQSSKSIFGLSPILNRKINIHSVPTVDSSTFDPDKHYFHHHSNGNQFETPVLIKNVLTKAKCEDTCDHIVQGLGQERVTLQRKNTFNGKEDGDDVDFYETEIAETTLMEALGYMM